MRELDNRVGMRDMYRDIRNTYEIKHNKNNKNLKSMDEITELENIDIIKWAFEQGYDLGSNDTKDGIHISFKELQRFFLSELAKHYAG